MAGSAGKPVDSSVTLCGIGNAPTSASDGQSSESKFGGANFMANEQKPGTQCTNGNSSSGGGSTWTIGHGNVNTGTERGTEHGQYLLEGTSTQGGFNGHVTDWDFNGGDTCTSADRTVYYQSGAATYCVPSFGPVGNFNTHGGASTGEHFRGKYGTIIFQQGDQADGGCYVGSQSLDATGPTASTLIKFDASIPPFVLKVRVDHSDTVNAKGVVTLKGTIRCENGSGTVDVELDLRQVVDRAIFSSGTFFETQCQANKTQDFRATVRPQNGLFGPGAASVNVFAGSGSHFVSYKVAVTLHAS